MTAETHGTDCGPECPHCGLQLYTYGVERGPIIDDYQHPDTVHVRCAGCGARDRFDTRSLPADPSAGDIRIRHFEHADRA